MKTLHQRCWWRLECLVTMYTVVYIFILSFRLCHTVLQPGNPEQSSRAKYSLSVIWSSGRFRFIFDTVVYTEGNTSEFGDWFCDNYSYICRGHCVIGARPTPTPQILHAWFDSWLNVIQGKVDGSASKPALVQDTNYMVKKTYHIAPYLGAFRAYLMPQWTI